MPVHGRPADRRDRRLSADHPWPIRKLLIANRGEIAVRIIRAARELGIRDGAGPQHGRRGLAGGAARRRGSRDRPAAGGEILSQHRRDACRRPGRPAPTPSIRATASSPRTPTSPMRSRRRASIFVGPSGETIRLMGDKVAAREAAAAAGVPTVPGSDGRLDDSPRPARAVAETIGFPVMIKAAAGGGGRGIRIAATSAEFERLLPQAQRRGAGGLRRWRALCREGHRAGASCRGADPRRRQRRHPLLRARMLAAAPPPEGLGGSALACRCRRTCARSSAPRRWRWPRRSTIAAPGRSNISTTTRADEFYFIEMNTRIQVEHPVTEMVTGIDLVREMIRIAGGEPLAHRARRTSRVSGHAIEVRINAEDPAQGLHARSRARSTALQRARRPGRALRHACSMPATRCRPSTTRCSAS